MSRNSRNGEDFKGIRLMIFEGAIGDAYGAGFEFVPRKVINKHNHLKAYNKHPSFPEMYGKYTDDTQMSIAIAELIISGAEFNKENLADKFVEVFKRDVRGGYAGGFFDFLSEIQSGEEFLEKIINTSGKNGAAMRAYPIGIFPNEYDVIDKANLQARLTHNTIEGIASSEAIALMAHYTFYNKGKLKDLPDYLLSTQGLYWNENWNGEVLCKAYPSVDAVLTLLCGKHKKMSKLLYEAVKMGGDVDTTASLALAIASNSDEIENDIPKKLIDDLEDGKYGKDFLKRIDNNLMRVAKLI